MSGCFSYFLSLVSRKDYSAWELNTKGQKKGFEAEEISEAIEQLQNLGYQSDLRLVENLIISYQKKYGKPVLKRKCLQKGISGDLFEEVWAAATAELENEDAPALMELKVKIMRKYKITDFQKLDPKTKSKIISYLQYRGFNAFQTLREWQEEEN